MKPVLAVTNDLISRLPPASRISLLAICREVYLSFGEVLVDAEEAYQYVYFPLVGFISLVASVQDHPPLEIGIIGNEGILGATLALHVKESPIRAVVQGSGTALRISAAAFNRELDKNKSLVEALNRYLHLTIAQLARSSACTRFHETEARLARWLLMTHDRAHSNTFNLTHEYLASMLGVRRSGVTIAAVGLQRKKLIHYRRGAISVIDREGLEAISCVCYAEINRDYATAFPAP